MGALGLLVLTLSALASTSADASVPAATHHLTAASGPSFVARHPLVRVPGLSSQPSTRASSVPAEGATALSGSGLTSPQAVAPLSTLSPACYGDSRSITPVGGTLDPASFGAFFYSPTTPSQPPCTPTAANSQWTFEVQTADTWPRASFGDWTVFLGFGTTQASLCAGQWSYFAQLAQTTQGTLIAQFGSLTSTCSFVPNPKVTASDSLNGNTVSVSFPESAIGNAATLVWYGELQSSTEKTQGGGDFVPCGGNPTCGGLTPDGQFLQGAVAESLPGTTPASCTTSPSTTQVVTLSTPSQSEDSNAVAALTNAGLTNVRDYGPSAPATPEGVISFTGSAVTAQTALATAGIPIQQVGGQPAIGPAQAYTPQAIISPADSGSPIGTQWNLGVIGAAGAQSVTKGNGVVVADIDTGVDYLDPNLGTNVLNGFDESTGVPMGLGPKSASLPEVGNTDTGQLNAGAGSATAGVIAAVTSGTGLTSLGLDTHVLPVKVDFDDTAASAEIDAGIRWAADNGARVINLPFAGGCPDPNLQSAIQYAQSKGDLVVVAAGDGALSPNLDQDNGTNDAPAYPAVYATNPPASTPTGQAAVVAVGAAGADGVRASYSDTGSYVSMVAPGGSDIPGDTAADLSLLAPGDQCPGEPCYTTGDGTGFAAAQASAESALIWAVNPTLTASQARELVTSTTTDQGVTGTDVEYGTGLENASVALTDTPPTTAGYGTFFSVSPFRLLDTRNGTGLLNNTPAKLGPGGTLALTVAGVPGSGVPANGVTAVVLNVTVTNPSASSFLTVWEDGQTRPNASNINFTPGTTLPNLVTVKVNPSNGRVDIFNSGGTVDVIADIGGYYVDGSGGTVGSTFVPVSPAVRLLDTRSCAALAPGCPAPGPIGSKVSRTLQVTGVGFPAGSPTVTVPDSATGVVLNVTVTGPTISSFLTVYPSNLGSPPTASNLNFTAGQTIPNLVSAQLGVIGAGPAKGVTLYNASGNVQVIVDLEGYFTAAKDTTGSRFFPLVSHRILDTRANIGIPPNPVGANTSIAVAIVGQGGVLDGGSAVVMNTTVTAPTQASFLTVFPSNPRPITSNLNFSAGQTIANLVSVAISQSSGQDNFYNAAGAVQVIADVQGWYGTPGT